MSLVKVTQLTNVSIRIKEVLNNRLIVPKQSFNFKITRNRNKYEFEMVRSAPRSTKSEENIAMK